MPYSGNLCDDVIHHILPRLPMRSFLDIGTGDGKYGRMVRGYHPTCSTEGIEIEADYVDRFGLRSIYDDLQVMDCMNLLHNPDAEWDLVIVGDVVEHLRKSDGIDLLNFLVYRAKWILVIFPERMIQNSWEGYKREAHISVWNPNSFVDFEPIVFTRNNKRVIAIDGYIAHQPEMRQVVTGLQ